MSSHRRGTQCGMCGRKIAIDPKSPGSTRRAKATCKKCELVLAALGAKFGPKYPTLRARDGKLVEK